MEGKERMIRRCVYLSSQEDATPLSALIVCIVSVSLHTLIVAGYLINDDSEHSKDLKKATVWLSL